VGRSLSIHIYPIKPLAQNRALATILYRKKDCRIEFVESQLIIMDDVSNEIILCDGESNS